MRMPGRCSPGRLNARRLRDESNPAILEQNVVDLPGAVGPDDVFPHDALVREQAQEACLSDAAYGDFVVF